MDATLLKEAIHSTIAEQILKSLDTEARDELVKKAMVDVLTSYRFENAVTQVIVKKAEAVAAELLETDNWKLMIRDAVERGLETYLKQLEGTTVEAVKAMFHGEDGTYGSKAGVLRFWPKPKT